MGYFAPAGEVPAAMAHFIRDVGHDAFLQARQSRSYELVTGDPQAVNGWFDGKVDFPVRVPANLGDYAMCGVRLWHTVSRLSALVSYESPGGDQVSLFVISRANLANRSNRTVRRGRHLFHTGESFQYNVAAWQDGECAYALVSSLATDDLLAMAENMSQRTGP
jgi:anti-sigma factor RsiW